MAEKPQPDDGVAVKVRDVPDRFEDGLAVAVPRNAPDEAPKPARKRAARKRAAKKTTGQSAETPKEK